MFVVWYEICIVNELNQQILKFSFVISLYMCVFFLLFYGTGLYLYKHIWINVVHSLKYFIFYLFPQRNELFSEFPFMQYMHMQHAHTEGVCVCLHSVFLCWAFLSLLSMECNCSALGASSASVLSYSTICAHVMLIFSCYASTFFLICRFKSFVV